MKRCEPDGPYAEIEVVVRRLVGPAVKDVVTGDAVPVGPAVDEPKARAESDKTNTERKYAVEKRRLSGKVLRRYGIEDRADDI